MPSENTPVLPPIALKRINAALALRDIPDYAAALDQLQKARSSVPDDAGLHLLLGLTYQDLGQAQEAEDSLCYALRLDPTSEQARQALGAFYFHQGRFSQAITTLQPLIEQKTPYLSIWQLYATAQRNLGENTQALTILHEAYARWPNNADLVNQLGHLMVELDRPEEARPILEHALTLQPSTGALCDLAIVHTMAQDYQTALQLLEQAIRRRPESSRAWRGIAYCHLHLNQLDKAHDAAAKALRFDENHFRSWQIMADVLIAQERRDEAFQVIEQGIRLAREAKDGQIVLENLIGLRAVEFLRKEGPDVALPQIECDLIELPNSRGLIQLKVNILVATNKLQETLTFLEKVQQSPLKIEQLESLAFQFYQSGNAESARFLFAQIIEQEPQNAAALNNLGFIVAGQEQWDLSATLIQRSLDAGFEMRNLALVNLGYVYLRQNFYDKAAELLMNLEQTIDTEEAEIVRVAGWYKNAFTDPLPEKFPQRPVSLLMAVRANLAIAQFHSGLFTEAITTAKNAIATAPNDPISYAVLGMLYFANARREDARMIWEQGIHQIGDQAHLSKTASKMRLWLTET